MGHPPLPEAAAARAAGLGEGFGGHSGRVGLAAELSRAGRNPTSFPTSGPGAVPGKRNLGAGGDLCLLS